MRYAGKYPASLLLHTLCRLSHKERAEAIKVVQIPLENWGCLDHNCDYEGFAVACTALSLQVAEFGPDLALGVDWSAWKAVFSALGSLNLPYVFLNYRQNSAPIHVLGTEYQNP